MNEAMRLKRIAVTRDSLVSFRRALDTFYTDPKLHSRIVWAQRQGIVSQISDLERELKELTAMAPAVINVTDSPSIHWQTPPHIWQPALRLWPTIDLDPAAPEGDKFIPAKKHYFLPMVDGLIAPWTARTVWLNPPYGRGIHHWITKLLDEKRLGHYQEALALVPASTDTLWGQALVSRYPVCFLKGRLSFGGVATKTKSNSATFASMLVYIGPNLNRFKAAYGDLGTIMART